MDPVAYWDFIVSFHERMAEERPAGLDAVLRIRELLEPTWRLDEHGRHPLDGRLRQSSEPNEEWLSIFVQKIEFVGQIPGGQSVIDRMGAADEYLAAHSEAEVALRSSLAGCETEFIPRSSDPSPDMVVDVEGTPLYVEVTSLNPPDQDRRATEAVNLVFHLPFFARVASGGVFARVPKNGELEDLRHRVQTAIDEAQRENRMVRVNVPGLVTCYFAPRERAHEIPERWRGSLNMRTPARLPKLDRIARKIDQKAKRQLPSDESGMLIIYDRITSTEDLRAKYDDLRPDITNVIETFPNLVGVLLVHPFIHHGALEEEHLEREERVFLKSILRGYECETCLGWRNPLIPGPMSDYLIQSFASFSSNLSRWLEPP